RPARAAGHAHVESTCAAAAASPSCPAAGWTPYELGRTQGSGPAPAGAGGVRPAVPPVLGPDRPRAARPPPRTVRRPPHTPLHGRHRRPGEPATSTPLMQLPARCPPAHAGPAHRVPLTATRERGGVFPCSPSD